MVHEARKLHGRRQLPPSTSSWPNSLRKQGAEILAASGSDWIVFSGRDGYTADEAYFLHVIIHTIYQALVGHQELDQAAFAAWIKQCRAQIETGELV
ncbi:MAG: hypothetical protein GY796_25845 [Chloroflexi bacterium]|nr:hypothetical protein [Chloroflexota bacterium]